MDAKLKIENHHSDGVDILADSIVDLVKIKDNFYFSIDGLAQELQIIDNTIKIIRGDNILFMKLNETVTSIYKNDTETLEIHIKLKILSNKANELHFIYSMMPTLESDTELQTLKVTLVY